MGRRPCAPLLALPLGVMLALTVPLHAQGGEALGVTPPTVVVDDAQRDETYVRDVVFQNRFDSTTNITLEPDGDVGAWTTTMPRRQFDIPAGSDAVVRLAIAVPDDQPNGFYSGLVRAKAEAKSGPDGSGLAVRHAVAVRLNVTVAGEAVESARWLDARAEDVEVGDAPLVFARALDDGNVRTTVRAGVEVLAHATDDVLGQGSGSMVLRPGEEADVRLPVAVTLPEGQYRARVLGLDPPGFERILEFQVVPVGTLTKSGVLKALVHPPWVVAGDPVRITGLFDNTGVGTIGRATLTVEVTLEGRLVGVVQSEARVVVPDGRAELATFFTPAERGPHALTGTVTYDGFETLPNESVLNVLAQPAGGGGSWWPWALVAAIAALVILLVLWRRRRDDQDEGDPPSPPARPPT